MRHVTCVVVAAAGGAEEATTKGKGQTMAHDHGEYTNAKCKPQIPTNEIKISIVIQKIHISVNRVHKMTLKY